MESEAAPRSTPGVRRACDDDRLGARLEVACARWAPRHNSLLIVTFDENAGGTVKSIPTIIVGANVRPGIYAERLDHYKLLRTIEDVYGLPALGRAKAVSPTVEDLDALADSTKPSPRPLNDLF